MTELMKEILNSAVVAAKQFNKAYYVHHSDMKRYYRGVLDGFQDCAGILGYTIKILYFHDLAINSIEELRLLNENGELLAVREVK